MRGKGKVGMARDPDVLDAQEAARFLGAHVETIRRLARKGEIPSFKVGKDWRFRRTAIERWADEHHARERERQRQASVLVVDDDEQIRVVIRQLLECEGYRVLLASDAGEGRALVRSESVDLVLLDLKLPGASGVDVIREIRARNKALPVVIITGYPDSDLMHQAMAYSPLLVLAKPFDANTLLTTVRSALAARR